MATTWYEMRTRTLGLGFEKTKAYEKNRQSYIDAYNWARTFIASAYGVITGCLEIEKEAGEPGEYDIPRLLRENGKTYSRLSQRGITDKDTGERIEAALVSDNRYLHLPACYGGTAKVWVCLLPRKITDSSPEETPCPLPEKWAVIMPYLMASRLYLDDDRSKAGYYWNIFDDMKNRILTRENTTLATVTFAGEDVWER